MRKQVWISTEFKNGKPVKVNYRPETPEEEAQREAGERKRMISGIKFSIITGIVFAAIILGALIISPDPGWHPKTVTDAAKDFALAFALFAGIGIYFTIRPRPERGPAGELLRR